VRQKLKGAARSKTMYFAIALAAAGAIQAQSDSILPLLGPHWAGLVLSGVGVAIAVLRVLTTAPLEDKGSPESDARDHDGLDQGSQ
jgi:hypothetical protein